MAWDDQFGGAPAGAPRADPPGFLYRLAPPLRRNPDSPWEHALQFAVGVLLVGAGVAALAVALTAFERAGGARSATIDMAVSSAMAILCGHILVVVITAPLYAFGYWLQRRTLGHRRGLARRRDRLAGLAFWITLFASSMAGPAIVGVLFLGPIAFAFFAAWLDNPFARLDRRGTQPPRVS